MNVVIAILIDLSVFLFILGIANYITPSAVKLRLATLAPRAKATKAPSFERRILPLAKRIGSRFRWLQPLLQARGTGTKLNFSGNPWGLDLEELVGLQILSAVAGVLLGVYLTIIFESAGVIFMPLLAVGGAYVPILWLNSKASARQRTIGLEMPEALEILAICAQAGLGFDLALEHLVEHRRGPLIEEFEKFLHELRVGVPRRIAYERLMARNEAKELHVVVNALVQSHEFGVPIADTLKEQAGLMRERRMRAAREEGARASPKISLVTAMVIAPSVMVLMVAVVAFHIFGQFTGIFGPGP